LDRGRASSAACDLELGASCKSNAKPMHSRLGFCEWCTDENPKCLDATECQETE